MSELPVSIPLVFKGKALFHITSRRNLPGILQKGLYCKNELARAHLGHESIADANIQARRALTRVQGEAAGTLHDYVPLFFGARPPMLYAIKFRVHQAEVVHLVLDWALLGQPTTVFTDGNAASASTRQFTGVANLEHVDWECCGARDWRDPEVRRKKAAEVLVLRHVEPAAIRAIVVMTEEEKKKRVAKIVKSAGIGIRVMIVAGFYY